MKHPPGIIGAILSVPLAAVSWAAIKAWNGQPGDQITDEDILRAERETVLDEKGQGRSATPEPEREQQEADVSVNMAKAQDRTPATSRTEATQPQQNS